MDKLPPSSGRGDGDRGHRSADLRSGAWRDWLAGPVDALDARVKGPEWAGRDGGPSQVIRPGSPLSSSSHPLRGRRVRDRWEKATQVLSPRRRPRRRCDREHEERAFRQWGRAARRALEPTDLSDTFSGGRGWRARAAHRAQDRVDRRARDACQPNSLKGAGGVRPLENVDTSVAFSPDGCKGEGSSFEELGGSGREVFTRVRPPHQTLTAPHQEMFTRVRPPRNIFTASHQEVLNLVPALPRQVTS